MSNLIFLIIGIILVFFLVFLLPSIEIRIRLWRRARRDYQCARGIVHLRLLKNSLSVLDKRIAEAQKALKVLEIERARLKQEKERKLEAALSKHLVDSEFTNITGIGPVLKDRVIRYCFDGTLKSLRGAGSVRGIGYQKEVAITRWLNLAEKRLPTLLQKGFPGKDGINKMYEELDKQKENEFAKINSDLLVMRDLKANASTLSERLKSVHPSTFVRAYKGNKEAAEEVASHMLGAFPEWGRMPEWFKTLIERYAEVSSRI